MNTLPGILAFTIFGTMTSARYIFRDRDDMISMRRPPYLGIVPVIDYPIFSDVQAQWVPYRTFDTNSYKAFEFPTYPTEKQDIGFVTRFLPPPFSRSSNRQKRSVNPLPPGMPLVMPMNRGAFPLYANMIGFRHMLPSYYRYDFDNLSSYKHGINPTSINPVPKGKFNFAPPVISPGVDSKVNMAPISSSLQANKSKLPAWYTQPDSWMWPQGHKSGPLFGVKRLKKSVRAAPKPLQGLEDGN
ncbi:uncharacterized protein LOC121367741 [Gigantopelta aegis]|uniref:uncharacterized protein LOC121367741 n=1 Tax=Gigantopelta aegis TaxID=1735272 RepID=UPI001B88C04A|nr:uncharacterized protein LOC121367741 [Gigantopelta aegis]XP_041348017.1 uncharacterized protein LOC121367741 [Gigantopelta aegis]